MANRSTRMAGADAAWLHLDRPRNRMIVNTVLWTSRPVDWDALTDRLERHVLPRFQRLTTRAVDPFAEVGGWAARWEAGNLGAAAHLVRARLPAPGDRDDLRAYVAGEAARPLPPDRPLWQLHLIDGHGTGSALLLRTHHAIADGTAIMRIIELLTEPADGDAAADQGVPAAGRASGGPRLFDPGTWTDPEVLTKLMTGIPSFTGPLIAPLSGTKSTGWTTAVPLDELRRAGAGHGATINDIGLAAVAGALRRHLVDDPGADIEAIVPVNLRARDEAVTTELGNRFGLVFVPLPIDEPDPGERIRRAKAEMDRIKATKEAQLVYDAFVVLGRSPRASARNWVDAFSRRASLVVTNIRGPARTCELGGAPVQGLVLLVPSTGPVGVGVSISTYAGRVRLALISDDAVVADPEGLQDDLDGALAELVTLGSGGPRPGVGGKGLEDLSDTVP